MFDAWPQDAAAPACRWPMHKTILLAAQHAARAVPIFLN
jgi:hypothetical protein